MITIDSAGISSDYGDDMLTWLWPWKRPNRESKYMSRLSHRYYSSAEEYWVERGRIRQALKDNKVLGFSLLDTLVSIGAFYAPKDMVIIVAGHSLDELMASHAAVMSKNKLQVLKDSDCVLIKVDDTSQASDLMEEIRSKDHGFGILLSAGRAVMTTGYMTKGSPVIKRIDI